jgi:hypothetical protein
VRIDEQDQRQPLLIRNVIREGNSIQMVRFCIAGIQNRDHVVYRMYLNSGMIASGWNKQEQEATADTGIFKCRPHKMYILI